jgi:hypothetical protein
LLLAQRFQIGVYCVRLRRLAQVLINLETFFQERTAFGESLFFARNQAKIIERRSDPLLKVHRATAGQDLFMKGAGSRVLTLLASDIAQNVQRSQHTGLMLGLAEDCETAFYQAVRVVKLPLEICRIALLIQRFGLTAQRSRGYWVSFAHHCLDLRVTDRQMDLEAYKPVANDYPATTSPRRPERLEQ